MLSKLKKSNSKGFTIIEVMIVLAIAGLILLIVLLAIPALQRNARNTAIKSDASSIAAGISTSESNNDGALPTAVNSAAGVVTITSTATDTIKIGSTTVVTTQAAVPAANDGASPATSGLGTVQVVPKFTCTKTANAKAMSVWYSTETSGSTVQHCTET